MTGLYLFFSPEGLDQRSRADFHAKVDRTITRLPGQPLELVENDHLIAATVHHGRWPSGGIAKTTSAALVATGAVWLEPSSGSLASPAEILEALQTAQAENRLVPGGVFSLASCDLDSSQLVAMTDRFGAYPLYYRQRGSCLAVASELKFLVDLGQEKVDEEGLADFLGMGFLPGSPTLVSGIKKLPPQCRLVATKTGLRVEPLMTGAITRDQPADDAALGHFDALVQRSLGRFADQVADWGVALSGGLDSRLVSGAAMRRGVRLEGFVAGEKGSKEALVARQVAECLGLRLISHEIDGRKLPEWFAKAVWFTEGRSLPNHMHYVCANLLGGTPAGPLLHGLIGEGIMGGYGEKLGLMEATPEKRWEFCRDFCRPILFWPQDSPARTFRSGMQELVRQAPARAAEQLRDLMEWQGRYSDVPDFQFRFRAVRFTVPCLLSQVLPWTDVVSPFLDTHIFDFTNTLEPRALLGRDFQLRWGLEYMPHFADVPRLKDGVLIPVARGNPDAYERAMKKSWRWVEAKYKLCRLSKGRINLPHRGSFPFYGQWYRRWKHVREYVDGIILSDQSLDRGLWRREGLEPLLKGLREGRNTWNTVGTILLVELFLRQFIDGTHRPEDPVVPLGLGR